MDEGSIVKYSTNEVGTMCLTSLVPNTTPYLNNAAGEFRLLFDYMMMREWLQ